MATQKDEPLPPLPLGAAEKHVVIIGGGVTGTLVAFELARAGHRVTLLEARGIGSGSSEKSAACTRQQWETASTVRGMLYATRFYKHWEEIVGGNECPIHQNGYLFLHNYQKSLDGPRGPRTRVEMQRANGLREVEWLEPNEIEERFPHLELTGIRGASWCPTDGFLRPEVVYGEARNAAEKLGTTIRVGAEVVAVDMNGLMAVSAKLSNGEIIRGDVFVNATNAWASSVARLFGGFDLPISARRRYLYNFPVEAAGAEWDLSVADIGRLPMTITPAGCYSRPTEGGAKLMTGWLHNTLPVDPTFDNQTEFEPGFREAGFYVKTVWKEIGAYLPFLRDANPQQAQASAGFYGETPDVNPIIGYDPYVPNLIHAAGFSGHGLMHAPFTSLIVAYLVAASRDVKSVRLPWGMGQAKVSTFRVKRSYRSQEDMQL